MSDQIGRNATTYHYRLYDAAGSLLYAGITTSVERRIAEHRPKRWYIEVASIETDEYPTRWRAVLAECVTGHGRYGLLPGGIGKGLAASMTDAELAEAAAHPAYRRWNDGALARQWGVPVQRVRRLRSTAAPASVRNHTRKHHANKES
jgi:hypothetical protein